MVFAAAFLVLGQRDNPKQRLPDRKVTNDLGYRGVRIEAFQTVMYSGLS